MFLYLFTSVCEWVRFDKGDLKNRYLCEWTWVVSDTPTAHGKTFHLHAPNLVAIVIRFFGFNRHPELVECLPNINLWEYLRDFLADLASPRVVTKIGIFLYDFIQLSIVYAEPDTFTCFIRQ